MLVIIEEAPTSENSVITTFAELLWQRAVPPPPHEVAEATTDTRPVRPEIRIGFPGLVLTARLSGTRIRTYRAERPVSPEAQNPARP
jgi:hypothetical protein